MKLVITIGLDEGAFNGHDCGTALSRIFRQLADRLEFETKRVVVNRFDRGRDLTDIDGNVVGKIEIVD